MEKVMMFATTLVPVVAALVELFKKTVNIQKNFIPAISLVVGLIIGLAAYPFTDLDTVLRLWAGGFAGLAGTGLFELVKKRHGQTKNKELK